MYLCIILAFTLSVHLYSLPFLAQDPHNEAEKAVARTPHPFWPGGLYRFSLLERNDFPKVCVHFLRLVYQNAASGAAGSGNVRAICEWHGNMDVNAAWVALNLGTGREQGKCCEYTGKSDNTWK